jgi:CheY-like chemotaxis protein
MGSIMIVDDMDLTLDILKRLLEHEGLTDVKTYDSPLDALLDLEQGIVPDLIVTDFRMPLMNGVEFLKRAKQLSPATRAIIISGDTQSLPALPKKYKILEKGGHDFFRQFVALIKSSLHYNTRFARRTAKSDRTSAKGVFQSI